MGQLLSVWRGENVAFDVEPYREVAAAVRRRAADLAQLDDSALEDSARALRSELEGAGDDEPLEEALVPVYALVYEAARRSLGLSAFDEQLMAAAAAFRRNVAELQTGEGKTLVAVFPAVLGSMRGAGTHVLTTNDYLATRDAEWMGPVYRLLGVSVAVLVPGASVAEKQKAYAADVTYGTLAEVGFDVLRDGLVLSTAEIVQRRGLHFAVLDDVDSTLIDEARHPLVVAGETDEDQGDDGRIDAVVRRLESGAHFGVDEQGESAFLTEEGASRVEEELGLVDDLFAESSLDTLTRVNLALHAHAVLKRDVDYLVRDGKIRLIDVQRGRVAADRRLPDGIQGALEDKEGLERSESSRVLAATTLQSVARLYPRLSGMTATAREGAEELGALYGLGVVVVPPHRQCIRQDYVDLVFAHGAARDRALREEILEAHRAGRPVLVGTSSVEESETLAASLAEQGLDCQVLNARNDELEAQIIAEAGAPGAITISTSMAGRGTDIRLGGADESRRAEVVEAGGLCVLGTRRSESERVDDQLRGRAGRQGDPGSSQLFVSLDDELFARHGARELLPRRYRDDSSDEPLLDKRVIKVLDQAQRVAAARSATIRKTLWGYDSIVEGQRRRVYKQRRLVLLGRGPSLVDEVDPELGRRTRERLGERRARAVERRLVLAWIDSAWADHLARLTDVREQVQLLTVGVSVATGFGREKPLQAFRRLARESFESFDAEVEEGLVRTFGDVASGKRVDLAAEGLAPPRRTWTYVVKEQPLETKPPQRLQVTLARNLLNLFGGKKRHE